MGTERLASIQSKQMPPIFFKTIITGKAKLVAVSKYFFHVKMGVGLAVRYCSALDTEASCIRKGEAPPTEREREEKMKT
jgi:hypothetical protein